MCVSECVSAYVCVVQELIELAERLGPAHSRGLSREGLFSLSFPFFRSVFSILIHHSPEINRLPSRTHRKKDGDDKRCVCVCVCMIIEISYSFSLSLSLYLSCVVCMCEFQVREKIRTLMPCRHDFHQKCIDKWLKVYVYVYTPSHPHTLTPTQDHSTCPICREKVKPTAS